MTLHLMQNEKFITPFIEFVKEHFDFEEHFFILVGGVSEDVVKIPKYENIIYLDQSYNSKFNYFKLSKIYNQYTKKADKIIVHSFIGDRNFLYLYFHQNLLAKSYWVMWGADLYVHNKPRIRLRDKIRHYIRTQVYKKIAHFITYIKGDYELAQKWYGSSGEYHECFMYPSNLYKEYDIKQKEHTTTNIQLGNSAAPTNNHIDVLSKLIKYKNEDIKIFAPLSYGDQKYAQDVIKKGKELFGDKFIPLTEFMPFEKYLEFLGDIDIAIFAHKRQQAMGNIISLLGLSKKVYMRSDITPWQLFNDIDVKVYDIANIEIDLIDKQIKQENQQKIKEYFSEEKLKLQMEKLFNGDMK